MEERKNIRSAFKKDGMFNEANPLMFELAKRLRKNMTHAEVILWGYLREGVKGLKFRRQHPIGIYVADFYCHKVKLIIEIDGCIHDEVEVKEHDMKRENDLKDWGYNILRFTNERTEKETAGVLAEISAAVENLTGIIIT